MDRNLPVRQVQDCPIYGGMIEAMDDAALVRVDAMQDEDRVHRQVWEATQRCLAG